MWLTPTAAKKSNKFLTDDFLKDMIPLFSEERGDHKCGQCKMRIVSSDADIADCTNVTGGISLSKGTCDLWNKGAPSSPEKKSPKRFTYAEVQYVETPSADLKIQCATCQYAEADDDEPGISYCLVWWRKHVNNDLCCFKYDNPKVVQPAEHTTS